MNMPPLRIFHPRRLSPSPGRRVVEPEWLPMLLSAMEEVAERGTANHIAPYNFPVAMKTGTARAGVKEIIEAMLGAIGARYLKWGPELNS